MCGINAILKKDGSPVVVSDISTMCAAITHRGPDDAGYAVLNPRLAFGHVRLSIIDLHSGDQPLYNEDGSICIVFNGEIYDYKQLREELLNSGHTFRTHTDTEVIVHLYEQYGMDFIHRLNGEFAFIIWDGKKRQLIAARDRCGVKPLFWHENSSEIIFSSEAKGILALPRIPRAISGDCLVGPIFGAMPRAMSAFEGINCISPGHFLIVDESGEKKEIPYWQPKYQINPKISYQEACEETRSLLTKAVKRRMVADVPVGTYLSGGLDSTLVCALATKESSKVRSFSIGFGNTIYDESEQAREIAAHYGAEFETINCDSESLADDYLKTIYHVEQPLANPNSVAKQALSRFVHSRGYKVCITGEGADELFGGYAYFKLEKMWRMLEAGGEEAREAKALMSRFKKMEKRSEGVLWTRGRQWKKLDRPFGFPSFHQMRITEASKHSAKAIHPDLLARAKNSSPLDVFNGAFPASNMREMDPFNATRNITFNQLVSYIIPTLGDRVEMANSVECRTPFLDKDLVEFAMQLDPSHCLDIYNLREKRVLREAFIDILPPVVAKVHKHPFLSPNWWSLSKTPYGKEIFRELLSKQRVKEAGLFQWPFVRKILRFWHLLPMNTTLWKKVDVLLGMVLSSQALHFIFVETPLPIDANFRIHDRTWRAEHRSTPAIEPSVSI